MWKEAKKFRDCGAEVVVLCCVKCGNTKIVPVGCDLRICPVCAHDFAVKIAIQIKRFWKAVQRKRGWTLKHITLPVKTDGDLQGAYDRGWRAWRRLWRKYLKEDGAGAVAAVEFGPKNGNVHFHVLYYGPYIPQAHLSDWWLELTGDSMVVDIRRLKDRGKGFDAAFFECLKYPAKFDELSPELAVDVLSVLKGTRRIQPYGIFFGKIRTKVYPICEVCGNDTWRVMDRGWPDKMFERYRNWLDRGG